jgi:hypothetical protein
MSRDNVDDAQALVAALRAEVAAQRELLRDLLRFGDTRKSRDAIRSHLAGAAVPAAEGHVFAKGDEVQCTGRSFSNPPNTVTAYGCVVAPKSHNDSVLVDFGKRYGGTWLVHPRDLVLVRKAGA